MFSKTACSKNIRNANFWKQHPPDPRHSQVALNMDCTVHIWTPSRNTWTDGPSPPSAPGTPTTIYESEEEDLRHVRIGILACKNENYAWAPNSVPSQSFDRNHVVQDL